MPLKQPAIMLAAAALCAAAASTPVLAQSLGCQDQYNRVMALYQTAPLSPEYSQMAAAYSARCLAGASAAPAYSGSPGYSSSAPTYYGPGYNPYFPRTSQHGTVQ